VPIHRDVVSNQGGFAPGPKDLLLEFVTETDEEGHFVSELISTLPPEKQPLRAIVATSEGIVVAKFNPYHVPGGSPAGGQFAEGGGGQAGGGLLHMQRGSGLGGKWTPDDLVRAGIQSTGLTLQNVKFRWSSKPEAYAVGRTITISRELQSDPRGLVRVVAHEAEHVKMTRSGETFNLSYGEVEQRARIAENIAERFVFGNRLHPLTGHVIEEKS